MEKGAFMYLYKKKSKHDGVFGVKLLGISNSFCPLLGSQLDQIWSTDRQFQVDTSESIWN